MLKCGFRKKSSIMNDSLQNPHFSYGYIFFKKGSKMNYLPTFACFEKFNANNIFHHRLADGCCIYMQKN